ncbi:hypothetical protein HanXRQr2_Chr02g0047661 [Helianthus annuus]|uniref:Uncharacterized protein n=1 Tax=Helianthus annuus TaxID=4232 RepID=A0A9K3JKU6_HELAN|nr:hypothetical protein HanXRQr2_Chr02g0047661 [Helianthus annuus]KAJ0950337.1 hypothetical protein HanPSC8_Chr02g0047121 [Helianthus annuus]
MEATLRWCSSGCQSHIRRQYKTDNHVFITVRITMGLKAPIWRILWSKMKKEKKNTHFSYDPCEYAQNFDEGLMVNDYDDLSRSFSARFAVPSTVVFDKEFIV